MQPIYQRLAEHYLGAIQTGTLKTGDRFPSVRRIMQTQNVSMGTAVQVCHLLEDWGHIQARPRSGYYVQHAPRAHLQPLTEAPRAAPAPPAHYAGLHVRISEWLAKAEAAACRINLSVAVAAPDLYPAQALQRIATAALRQQPTLLTTMTRRYGHPELRAALAKRAVMRGMNVHSDQIIITQGCAEALTLALRATCQSGDVVAVESPTFYGVLQTLESLGLKALELPTSPRTGLSLEALDMAWQQQQQAQQPIKALLVMPTLHNPLGCTMPDEHKAQLVQWCAQHRLPLIEDDIYSELDGELAHLRPAKAWDTDGTVIFCGSLNKVLAPGLRLGWMDAGRWQARVQMIKYSQSRFPEELSQVTAGRFMASGAYDRHMRQLQRVLRGKRQHMADAIAREFGNSVKLHMPTGGLLMWLALPPGVSSLALGDTALKAGVSVLPGALFSARDGFDGYLRLSCGLVSDAEMNEGIAILARLVSQLQSGRGSL